MTANESIQVVDGLCAYVRSKIRKCNNANANGKARLETDVALERAVYMLQQAEAVKAALVESERRA